VKAPGISSSCRVIGKGRRSTASLALLSRDRVVALEGLLLLSSSLRAVQIARSTVVPLLRLLLVVLHQQIRVKLSGFLAFFNANKPKSGKGGKAYSR
jgi:hypothetical protein